MVWLKRLFYLTVQLSAVIRLGTRVLEASGEECCARNTDRWRICRSILLCNYSAGVPVCTLPPCKKLFNATLPVCLLPTVGRSHTSDCNGCPPATAKQNGTMINAGSELSEDTYVQKLLQHVDHAGKEKISVETIPFIGLTKNHALDKHCCKNGGTCVLGSFCACPKHYTGRYCELHVHNRKCGIVPHGHWVQKKCALCRCMYGTMHCFPSGDCDAKDYVEESQIFLSSSPRVRSCLIAWFFLIAASNTLSH
uniref:Cripto-3 long n=1 Tax=Xenopus laevis TaxID=8355 RepID=Q2UZ94_XENLA|nr:Cripto-3 long [Xenopus laevis]